MPKFNRTMISSSKTTKKLFLRLENNFKKKEAIRKIWKFSTKQLLNLLSGIMPKSTTFCYSSLKSRRFNLRKGLSKLRLITIRLSVSCKEGSRMPTNIYNSWSTIRSYCKRSCQREITLYTRWRNGYKLLNCKIKSSNRNTTKSSCCMERQKLKSSKSWSKMKKKWCLWPGKQKRRCSRALSSNCQK